MRIAELQIRGMGTFVQGRTRNLSSQIKWELLFSTLTGTLVHGKNRN